MPNFSGQTVGGKVRIIAHTGSGGFGDIYDAIDDQGTQYIAKFEKESSSQTVRLEVEVYRLLSGAHGFASLHAYGVHHGHHFLVMRRLGSSLQNILERCGGRFSASTTAMIGIQLLFRLERLHSFGFIHGDLKPGNVVVERPGDCGGGDLFLIDFGAVSRYRTKDGTHIEEGFAMDSLVGSKFFAPIKWHTFRRQSRKDDLQSLAYMLAYFYCGDLPWEFNDPSDDILQKKVEITAPDLLRGLPEEMVQYYDYVQSLGFNEQPDYDRMRRFFRTYLQKRNIWVEEKFDWLP